MNELNITKPISTRVFIDEEIKNKAKKRAIDLGLTFKEFLNMALLEMAEKSEK